MPYNNLYFVINMSVYFDDIEFHILKHLSASKQTVLIAMAWFTNTKIGETLVSLLNKQVHIELLIDDNEINRISKNIKYLQGNGINITFINNDVNKSSIMHNKFCVIDFLTVLYRC